MEDKRTTESVVQEIMGLVERFGYECVKYENIDPNADPCFIKSTVESKLRELVERCSVREPLSDADLRAEYLEDTSFEGECAAFRAGARYAERFYNITNTNKE